jgi:hypothetical protein
VPVEGGCYTRLVQDSYIDFTLISFLTGMTTASPPGSFLEGTAASILPGSSTSRLEIGPTMRVKFTRKTLGGKSCLPLTSPGFRCEYATSQSSVDCPIEGGFTAKQGDSVDCFSPGSCSGIVSCSCINSSRPSLRYPLRPRAQLHLCRCVFDYGCIPFFVDLWTAFLMLDITQGSEVTRPLLKSRA